MIIKILTHLMTATAGFLIAYLIFSQQTSKHLPIIDQPSVVETNKATNQETHNQAAKVSTPVTQSPEKTKTIKQFEQVLAEQAQTIEMLQQQLEQAKQDDLITALDDQDEQDQPDRLETISMDDFEERLKGSFRNRFKSVAIELKANQVEEFEKMFAANSQKSEWGAQFENQITDFVTSADRNGFHFIEEVNCTDHMCRLKIQSNETDDWQSIYSKMTQQNWFDSMTLVDKSTPPGTHVYYIPKPQGM